jgi:protein pelota
MTIVKANIEVTIPKKRYTETAHDKASEKFYGQVKNKLKKIVQAIVKYIDFKVIKVVLVASPGFYKETLFNFMIKESQQKEELKYLSSNKEKFLLGKLYLKNSTFINRKYVFVKRNHE